MGYVSSQEGKSSQVFSITNLFTKNIQSKSSHPNPYKPLKNSGRFNGIPLRTPNSGLGNVIFLETLDNSGHLEISLHITNCFFFRKPTMKLNKTKLNKTSSSQCNHHQLSSSVSLQKKYPILSSLSPWTLKRTVRTLNFPTKYGIPKSSISLAIG